jgi:hypothetical protein
LRNGADLGGTTEGKKKQRIHLNESWPCKQLMHIFPDA